MTNTNEVDTLYIDIQARLGDMNVTMRELERMAAEAGGRAGAATSRNFSQALGDLNLERALGTKSLTEARDELKRLESELETELSTLQAGTDAYRERAAVLVNVRNQLEGVSAEIDDVGQNFRQALGDLNLERALGTKSIEEARAELQRLESQLTSELSTLEQGTDAYRERAAELVSVRSQLEGVSAEIEGMGTTFSQALGDLNLENALGTQSLEETRNGLRELERSLEAELSTLEQGTDAYRERASVLVNVRSRLEGVNEEIEGMGRNYNEALEDMQLERSLERRNPLTGMFDPRAAAEYRQQLRQLEADLEAELATLERGTDAYRERANVLVNVRGEIEGMGSSGATAGERISMGMRSVIASLPALAATAAAAVGAAFATGIVGVTGLAAEAEKNVLEFQASLGVTKNEAEDLGKVAEEVFRNNFGQSLGEAAEMVRNIRQEFKELSSKELESLTIDSAKIAQTFDEDQRKVAQSIKSVMEATGASAKEATDLIAKGFQEGLNVGDDLLDTLLEYGPQFKNAKINLGELYSLLQTGAAKGVLGTDKVADAFKEFGFIIADVTKNSSAAYAELGLNQQKMVDDINAGKLTQTEAFKIVQEKLAGVQGAADRTRLSFAMFSSAGEDLASLLTNVDLSKTKVEDLAGAADKLNAKYSSFGQMFKALWRDIQVTLLPVGKEILKLANDAMPEIKAAIESARPIVVEFVQNLVRGIREGKEAFERFGPQVNEALEPFRSIIIGVVEVVSGAFEAIKTLIQRVFIPAWEFVGPLVSRVVNAMAIVIKSNLDGIATVFRSFSKILKGDWAGTWDEIKGYSERRLEAIKKFIADAKGFKTAAKRIGTRIKEGILAGVDGLKAKIISMISAMMREMSERLPAIMKPAFDKAAQFYDEKAEELEKRAREHAAKARGYQGIGPQMGGRADNSVRSVQGLKNIKTLLGLGGARVGTPYGQHYTFIKPDGHRHSGIHNGEDIFAKKGTPVLAPFTGRLSHRVSKSTGNIVEIIDRNGNKMILGHLESIDPEIKQRLAKAKSGVIVRAGTRIATVGNTGSLTGRGDSNAHIHLMARLPNGKVVDPKTVKFVDMDELPDARPVTKSKANTSAGVAKPIKVTKANNYGLTQAEKAALNKDEDDKKKTDQPTFKLKDWAKYKNTVIKMLNELKKAEKSYNTAEKRRIQERIENWQGESKVRQGAVRFGKELLKDQEAAIKAQEAREKKARDEQEKARKEAAEKTKKAQEKRAKDQERLEKEAAQKAEQRAKEQAQLRARFAEQRRQLDITEARQGLERVQTLNRQELEEFKGSSEKRLQLVKRQAKDEYNAKVTILQAERRDSLRDLQNQTNLPTDIRGRQKDGINAIYAQGIKEANTARDKAIKQAVKIVSDEVEEQAKAEAELLRARAAENSAHRISIAKELLSDLKKLQSNELKEHGKTAEQRLKIHQNTTEGILEAEQLINATIRDEAIRAAEEEAKRKLENSKLSAESIEKERKRQVSAAYAAEARANKSAQDEQVRILKEAGEAQSKEAEANARELQQIKLNIQKETAAEASAQRATELESFEGNAKKRLEIVKEQAEAEYNERLKIAARERDLEKQANQGAPNQTIKDKAADQAYNNAANEAARARDKRVQDAKDAVDSEVEQVKKLVQKYTDLRKEQEKQAKEGKFSQEQFNKTLVDYQNEVSRSGLANNRLIQSVHESTKAWGQNAVQIAKAARESKEALQNQIDHAEESRKAIVERHNEEQAKAQRAGITMEWLTDTFAELQELGRDPYESGFVDFLKEVAQGSDAAAANAAKFLEQLEQTKQRAAEAAKREQGLLEIQEKRNKIYEKFIGLLGEFDQKESDEKAGVHDPQIEKLVKLRNMADELGDKGLVKEIEKLIDEYKKLNKEVERNNDLEKERRLEEERTLRLLELQKKRDDEYEEFIKLRDDLDRITSGEKGGIYDAQIEKLIKLRNVADQFNDKTQVKNIEQLIDKYKELQELEGTIQVGKSFKEGYEGADENFVKTINSTAQAFGSLANPLSIFAEILNRINPAGAILEGIFSVLAEPLKALTEPFKQIGHLLGSVIAPVLEVIAPVLTFVSRALTAFYDALATFLKTITFGLVDITRRKPKDEKEAPAGSIADGQKRLSELRQRLENSTDAAERERLRKDIRLLEQRLNRMRGGSSGRPKALEEPEKSNSLVRIPNSQVTVMAAPAWVERFGQHVDRFGGYVNNLTTTGIRVHVETDKTATPRGNSLAYELRTE